MLVCYLDDSNAEEGLVITIAGYMASIEQWRSFEEAVEPIFARNEVPILHSKEFYGTKGCFKGWPRVRKDSFIEEIYDVAQDKIQLGISRSVNKREFREAKKERKELANFSALGAAFGTVVHSLAYLLPTADLVHKEGLSFVVEEGHRNNRDILDYYSFMNRRSDYSKILGPLQFQRKSDSRAIQMADFLAMTSRRMSNMVLTDIKLKGIGYGSYTTVREESPIARVYKKIPHDMYIVDTFSGFTPTLYRPSPKELNVTLPLRKKP